MHRLSRALRSAGAVSFVPTLLIAAAAAAPTTATWTLLGPDGAFSNYLSEGFLDPDHAIAGRMLDLEFDPNDVNVLYAAAAGGGLWRTTDFGDHWASLTDAIPVQALGGIAVSRADSDVLVIGTGEGTKVEGQWYSGAGILRSTDGGGTWTSTQLDGGSWPGMSERLGFHFIEAGPTGNEGTFLAGGTKGLYRSTDSGDNWSLVASGDSCQYYDAKWKPGSSTIVYACVGNGRSGTAWEDSCGVMLSTDDGATWDYRVGTTQQDPTLIGKTKLAVSPAKPDWVYALYANRGIGLGHDSGVPGGTDGAVYRSTDGGATWSVRDASMTAEIGGQLGYNLVLLASPTDAGKLLAAGERIATSATGGDAWTFQANDAFRKDFHAAVYHPGKDSVWIACDQGVYVDDDDGTPLSWGAKNETLTTLQFYDIAANNRPGAFWMVGGTQDTGSFQLRPGSTRWENFFGGDGKTAVIDASTEARAYANPRQFLFRTTDEGANWSSIGGTSEGPALDVSQVDGVIYHDHGAMVQKSTDHGSSWTPVPGSTRPTWLSISRADPDLVWWIDASNAYYTADNGDNMVVVAYGAFPHGTPTKVLAHPTDANTALVTLSSYSDDTARVALTTDLGDSWTEVSGDLPEQQPVNAIAINPSAPSDWFIGTNTDVWLSTNGGAHWEPYGQGLPHAFVYDLEIDNGRQKLVAGTHGRSVWEVDIFGPGDTITWTGVVNLTQDFVVPAGAVLNVAPGTIIRAVSDTDDQHGGRYPDKVELIVQGQLGVEGTVGQPVVFTSTGQVQGDWGGIQFDLAASASGYGYTCASALRNATIKYAADGLAIEQTGAPSLEGVTFVQNERDIVLDQTDVYVPYHGVWSLTAPTTVKVISPTRPGQDIGDLNPGKVDLVVQGRLDTSGSGSDWVTFEPDPVPVSSTSGDEWGGIFFDWANDSTSNVSHADIGYALTPVSLLATFAGATIQDSRIHHFRDRGIWADANASILGNSVFRDTTGTAPLDAAYGNEGIVVEGLRPLVSGNTVRLAGMFNGTGGAGIHILNTKYCCSWIPITLSVASNTVLGPGARAFTGQGKWSGIFADAAYANGVNQIVLSDNVVKYWNKADFEFKECTAVRVAGNVTDSSLVALDFFRGNQLSGSAVRLRGNCFKIGDFSVPFPGPNQAAIRVDNALQLWVGPDSVAIGTGRNVLLARGPTKVLYENDPDVADSLDARANYWERNGTALTSDAAIRAQIEWEGHASDPTQVKVAGGSVRPRAAPPQGARGTRSAGTRSRRKGTPGWILGFAPNW